MEVYTENLESYMFEQIENCTDSIIIISPFLSKYTVKKLIETVKKRELNCTIVTRFDRKAFIDGASSIEALQMLIDENIEVLALKDLHSKVYVFDDKQCMVGSANFTKKALKQNHELLMFLSEEGEVLSVKEYVKKLIIDIRKNGNYEITKDDIKIELAIRDAYKDNKEDKMKLNYQKGAELSRTQQKKYDNNSIVLSVSAGGTHQLIDKYLIHAHPHDSNYNYNRLENLITFRQANGGKMNAIFLIESTFVLDPANSEEELKRLSYEAHLKDRINHYILDRKNGFTFEKPIEFKFYILSLVEELTHGPEPRLNNAGPRYYTLGELLSNKYL